MALFENPLAEVLRGSFREWGRNHKTYKATYKKLNDSCFHMADVALGELDIFAPGPLWTWYTRHHMRFYKMNNTDLRITMELLQIFLADYAHGRLREIKPVERIVIEETSRSAGETPDRSEGSNASRRLPFVRSSKKPAD